MTATKTEFEYTEFTEPNSSAVSYVYYNRYTKELVVELLDSGSAYRYYNVPQHVFDQFNTPGYSAGNLYATVVKRDYGPGTYEGTDPYYDEYETHYDDEVPVTPVNYRGAAVATTPRSEVGKGGSKDLTYATHAIVDGQRVSEGKPLTESEFRLDLSPVQPRPDETKFAHRVDFTVEGGTEVKSYSVDAVNVDAAVEALAEISYAIGVNLDVKGVYVSFE